MKRKLSHPEPLDNGKKRYWRSLDEFAQKPEFKAQLEREFPQGAAEYNGNEVSRRSFLHLMGASVALAGLSLTGCRRPEIDIVSYTKGVEWQIPGKALRYATSMPRRGGASPLLATSYNGRPTKLEGNAIAGYNGSTDSFSQAAILDLYDPDRSKAFLTANIRGSDYSAISSDDFFKTLGDIRKKFAGNQGSGLAILVEPSTSPTRQRLAADLRKQFPNMLWVEHEPWSLQTQALALGNHLPIYHFEKADVILALDCDFLGATDGDAKHISGFAAGRRKTGDAEETMARLYAVEARFSLTGGMADHRLRVTTSGIAPFALQLLKALGGSPTQNFTPSSDPNVVTWITELANDLNTAKGRSLVVAGAHQPALVHTVVAQINDLLGNSGKTVEYGAGFLTDGAVSLSSLATQMKASVVDTLFVIGGNPAFNAPVDLDFANVLNFVPQVIHLGLWVNETTAASTLHVPAAHFLETWGDSAGRDSTYFTQQPLILPLYDGVSEIDLLAALAGWPAAKGAEYIQDTFGTIVNLQRGSGKPFDDAWRQAVHDGFAAKSNLSLISPVTYPPVAPTAGGDASPSKVNLPPPLAPDSFELSFVIANLDDGRYANNSWLQELPDPVSKVTWENVLYVSQKTAKALGVEVLPNNHQDLPNTDIAPDDADPGLFPAVFDTAHTIPTVTITVPGPKDGYTLTNVPVLVAPGQHDQTLTLAVGWGASAPRLTTEAKALAMAPLRVADGSGVNAYLIRTSDTLGFVSNVKVTKTTTYTSVAIAQEHNSMEGRGLVREASLDEYHKNKAFVQEIGIDQEIPQGDLKGTGYQKYESSYVPPALNSPTSFPDRPAWGMTIDLNTCVGCSACIIACQAENNIPVVGKWQVLRGREMHWIRMDRYYGTDVSQGDPTDSSYLDEPQMLFQPMACQQCEIAPCEPVCPVNATAHNEEGLSVIAYNRCIGTRYCANNCPYKVRRFNFFNYNDRPIENVKTEILGMKTEVGQLYLGPLAGKDGPLTTKGVPDSLTLQKNPNVTVRIRGVIEKCTYCVQRIEEAKISQLRKSTEDGDGSGNVTLPTDNFKVACQQVCPAEAITFGNMNDKASKVSLMKQDERNYGVLAYLGTRPRTSYLGRVRNPNPAMPGANKIGHTSRFHEEKHDADTTGASSQPEGTK